MYNITFVEPTKVDEKQCSNKNNAATNHQQKLYKKLLESKSEKEDQENLPNFQQELKSKNSMNVIRMFENGFCNEDILWIRPNRQLIYIISNSVRKYQMDGIY